MIIVTRDSIFEANSRSTQRKTSLEDVFASAPKGLRRTEASNKVVEESDQKAIFVVDYSFLDNLQVAGVIFISIRVLFNRYFANK